MPEGNLMGPLALAGLPALPRLSLTQWLLAGALAVIAALLIALYGLQIDLPLIGKIGPEGVIAERDTALTERDAARKLRAEERANHIATKKNIRGAQAEAARRQAAFVAAETARQERIVDEARADFARDSAALRARADRLLRDARAGTGVEGNAGAVRVPEAVAAPGRTDEAPDCEALPAPDLTTEIRCREIAEQQALQLDALITFVERQIGKPEDE